MWKGIIFILIVVALGLVLANRNFVKKPALNTISTDSTEKRQNEQFEVVATNLEVPWALAFLPNGDLLITERKGTVKLLKDGQVKEVAKLPEVKQIGEGGLHGIAVDPKFLSNNYIYLYLTYGELLGNTQNQVVRYKFINNTLSEKTIIVDNIPGALTQNPNSLAGKILRVNPIGEVEIFSLGHRNPQGITWDSEENLWEVEHGSSAFDEINLISKGKNYGWPDIRGDEEKQNMEKPVLHSGNDTWAPAGVAFHKGSLYFGGLRGQALYQYDIKNKQLKTHFKEQFGRIRDVIIGPDNMLYITTSNRDGRGNPADDDDKIIRVLF
ncbi:PQQ-dependent sugar dehydrogenase [Candidatus Microgenomates bacterium]|nr:PQQ-dependent sugar dehydrogenase [Candidatus Microgenomates bacterium]